MNEEELTLALQNAKEVSRKLSFPWGRLFTTLGLSSVQKDLALVSVEPDANTGQLVVVGEARNFRAMLYFLHALQASPMFEDVSLQSHYINHTIEENPIRFRLLAKWSTSK
jgi:Tfp pilus assembly protein PilN